MVENEGEKLFLVKNLFSLRKVDGKVLFSNEKIVNLPIIKYALYSTNQRLVFITYTSDLLVFYKKAIYEDLKQHRYRIHHKCFNDLQEWLKEKQETNLIL